MEDKYQSVSQICVSLTNGLGIVVQSLDLVLLVASVNGQGRHVALSISRFAITDSVGLVDVE